MIAPNNLTRGLRDNFLACHRNWLFSILNNRLKYILLLFLYPMMLNMLNLNLFLVILATLIHIALINLVPFIFLMGWSYLALNLSWFKFQFQRIKRLLYDLDIIWANLNTFTCLMFQNRWTKLLVTERSNVFVLSLEHLICT